MPEDQFHISTTDDLFLRIRFFRGYFEMLRSSDRVAEKCFYEQFMMKGAILKGKIKKKKEKKSWFFLHGLSQASLLSEANGKTLSSNPVPVGLLLHQV